MAVFETWLDQDLKKPVRIQYLSGNLFSQDNMGNLIGVNVTDDGAPATLGGSVSANVIRADGATVAVDSGVLSGNKASVTLPQAAYAVPGVITVVIKITSGTDVTTLAAVVTTVYRSSTDTIVDPGTIIPSIQALISQIETAVASIPSDYSSLWTTLAPAYSTSATYAVGQYVTYNGGLYRCTTAITSAESWTAAHWTAAKVGNDLSDLKSALSDYSNYIGTIGVMDGYGVSEYYQKIVTSFGSKCVYFAVQPNTLYRINKTVITSRFVVGATESTPTSNVATTNIVRNDSATSIEFLTGASDQYICVMVYSSSDSMSWSSVLASISVQIESANDRNARARIGIAENKLNDLITEITPIITNGYFVSNTGSYSSNSSFMVTEPFKVYRNTKLFVYARGYNTNVAIISRVDADKINYVPKVICTDGTARVYEFVVTESGYYAISGNKDTAFVIYAIPYPANDTQINLAMFQNFGVVGDSYASGVIFSDNNTSYTKYECSWGQIIARDCGTHCTNYSEGGLSTRTWLTDADHGLPFLLNSDPEDIYYLALGINDYYLLGEDYLGTESDIGDDSKDTFYGNYSKIISAIMTHAPKAKLIMFTCSNTNEVPQMFNDAIIKIAIHYSIPYIIQADDEYFQSREYTAMVGSHPTAVGYAGMAETFKRLISDAVKDNYYYFWKMYAYGT